MLQALKGWSQVQKKVVLASFLGWMLDAFDFFLLVFVLGAVAREFGVQRPAVALAITLTLALRPLGAFVFGRLADRFGRRPTLMGGLALYTIAGAVAALAPSVHALIAARLFQALGGCAGLALGRAMVRDVAGPVDSARRLALRWA